MLAFYHCDLYGPGAARPAGRSAQRIPRALGLAVLPLAAGHALFPDSHVAGAPLLGGLLTALVLMLVVRATAYRLIKSRPFADRVIVVGTSALAHQLVAEIKARPHLRQLILGVVNDGSGTPPPRCRVLGGLQDLGRIVDQDRPTRIVVALPSRRGRLPFKTLLNLRMRGLVVEEATDVYERLTGKIAVEALTPSSLIFCNDYRAYRPGLALGRALSLPSAVVSLVVLAPLLALIALVIKLDSPGPVFFIQERVGRAGRLFRLIKFRTMRPAHGATSEWVRDNADRLTRVGRWLRRFRLDELPQLVNIIMGDMNMVGPRPHPVSNLAVLAVLMRNAPDCGEQIPYYALRSLVRPGLTGWAQVRYRYANDFDEEIEKMRYDLYYVKHMSAWLDLRILFETIRIVVLGRGSVPARVVRAALPAAANTRKSSSQAGGAPRPAFEVVPAPSDPMAVPGPALRATTPAAANHGGTS